jgi:hypothetical protein|tara:strand:- start:47885 stop:48043 length:159 start_codon:yes stop_codon:yes gene_type:complete
MDNMRASDTAVSDVSDPEKKPDKHSRQKIIPEEIQNIGSSKGGKDSTFSITV